MNAKYGTYAHGRLTYRTAEEARGAARDLGISNVHSHMDRGEKVFMPGGSCTSLDAALKQMGLPPAKRCGGGDAGGEGGGLLGGAMMDDVPSFEQMDQSDEWGF